MSKKQEQEVDLSYDKLKEAKALVKSEDDRNRQKLVDGIRKLEKETGYVVDVTKPQMFIRKTNQGD